VISYGGSSRRLGGFNAPGDYAVLEFLPTSRHNLPAFERALSHRVLISLVNLNTATLFSF